VASSSRDAVADSAIVEEFEVDAGTVGVTLEAVEVTEAVTTMDGAITVEVTFAVLLVRGTLLGAAISGADVAVSVPVVLTVMVGKMGRPCWMLVEEPVAVGTSVPLAVTVLVGETDEALPVMDADRLLTPKRLPKRRSRRTRC
jgi:hypothetical protein